MRNVFPPKSLEQTDKMKISKTEGLVAASFTPMDERGGIVLDRIPAYAEWLRSQGVAGVFVNGTTGESMSLSSAERMSLAEAWRAVKGDLRLFVHVGHNSLPEARALAAHAERIGADAIAIIAPSFFKPALSELVDFAAAVASAAPSTPLYFYHMPAQSGVNVSVAAFLKAAAPKIPTLAGIKFTFENIMDYQKAVEFDGGRYDVLFGRDEILLPALAAGARGAVGSTYNHIAPVYREVIEAWNAGDAARARAAQAKAQAFVDILIDAGNGIVCGKAMMKMFAGIDCGPVRLPLAAFPDDRLAWLESRVAEWKKL